MGLLSSRTGHGPPDAPTTAPPARAPRGRRHSWITASIAVVLAAVLAGCAAQQAAPVNPPPGPPAAPSPTDAAAALTTDDVQAWLDGFMPAALEREGVAGAVVSVVHDGQVLTERGYGYAHTAAATGEPQPVDAQSTLFRVGSISKLTVATAVMQLVEDGRVDLDDPVADLIDLHIPTAFDEPITLRHLLSHTAGFEERMRDLFLDPDEQVPPLGQALADPPEQIFAPGTTPAYSNYGNALAAYAVEQVSGMTFADYAEAHIFTPLEMDTATLAQPLPPDLAGQMSSGYEHRGSEPIPFEHVNIPPAGAMSAAAPDMSAFMLAHLDGGAPSGEGMSEAMSDRMSDDDAASSPVLSPESVAVMQQPALGEDTLGGLVNAHRTALGWYEQDRNGHRILDHGGDTLAFHAQVQIYPESATGIYIALNSAGVRGQSTAVIREQVLHGFTDRYFPAPGPDSGPAAPGADAASGHAAQDADTDTDTATGAAAGPASGHTTQATDTAAEHAQVLAGRYMTTRVVESNFGRLLSGLTPVTVSATEDGIVTIAGGADAAGLPLHLVEVQPWVWQEIGGQQRIAADVVDGQVRLVGIHPTLALQPMPATLAAVLPVLIGSLVALMVGLAGWPVTALVRRRYRYRAPLSPRQRRLRLVSMLGAAAALAAVALWGTLALMIMGTGSPPSALIRLAQVLTLLGALGVVPAAARAVVSAGERRWWQVARDVLLTLAFAGFGYVAIVGRLLGWDITY